MNVCIFIGPTLAVEDAAQILDAVYLSPAAQGDVMLAAQDGADVIGIVDGYFQGAPSVWHKEILWAMSRGVHVYGSASMGALRAAELADFGMQGVGRVFEAYRDGTITDDDEVAVVHGPEEMGYRARTVPLVDMRATLAKALDAGVVGQADHDAVIEAGRSLFYWDRTWEALKEGCAGDLEEGARAALFAWIQDNAVDQKRADAIEMLHRLTDPPRVPFRASFAFQRTDSWESLRAEVMGPRDPTATSPADPGVLDELRLLPELYGQIPSAPVSGTDDGSGVARDGLGAGLIDSPHYDALSERAADKSRVLLAHFGSLPEYADAMLAPADVLEWYFEDCHGLPVPMDLDGYAKDLGMNDSRALCRLLLHDLLYEMLVEDEQAEGAGS